MKESILQKFIRLFRDIDKEILPNANVLERIYIVFDFLWEKIKYNIELIDYVQYRFYFKRRIERDQFITHGKLLKIIKICNDPKSRIFFDQKPLFNQEFKDYLGRDWLDTKVILFVKEIQHFFANLLMECLERGLILFIWLM